MKKNNSFKEIWNKIKESKKLLISLHKGPDGDSLGSCSALKYVLERDFGIIVKLISPDELDKILMKLSFTKEVEFGKNVFDINLSKFDILITLDSSSFEMLGNKEGKFPKDLTIINIDHHPTNSYYASLNYVDAKAASTCSILLNLFENMGVKFDKELTNRLLLGVCTDSSFFTVSNAVPALKDASRLIEKGADYFWILQNILFKQPLNLRKYFAYIIDHLRINKEKKFCYSLIPYEKVKELDLNLAEVRLGPKEIGTLDGFDFAFILVEMENMIKGSFRSSQGVDVSLFAKELGGGGHKAAAGVYLERMSLREAEKKVLEAIEKIGIHKI